ncbi:hypothetical protein [Streptomyces sp. NPDC002346]
MISYDEDYEAGTATIHFGHVRRIDMCRRDDQIDSLTVVVPRSSYRASRHREMKRADELEKQLNEAREAVARLRDERDEWQEKADEWQEKAEELSDAKPRAVWHITAGARDWTSEDLVTAELREVITLAAPVGSLVDDLKAAIVSQAREIARLKGESA